MFFLPQFVRHVDPREEDGLTFLTHLSLHREIPAGHEKEIIRQPCVTQPRSQIDLVNSISIHDHDHDQFFTVSLGSSQISQSLFGHSADSGRVQLGLFAEPPVE